MAQKPGKLVSVGFGIETGIPVSNTLDAFNFTFGMTARVAVHAGPGFATFTTGGIVYVPKSLQESSSARAGLQIPIKAGYKYIFVRHFFVMGEVGYSVFKTYYDNGQNDQIYSTSTGGFTFAPAIGVQFGVTELALRYESMRIEGRNADFVGFRVGFNF
jgi:hypothetical protein